MDTPKLVLPEETPLTPEEAKGVGELLSNPAVQKYFRLLHANAMKDVLDNEVETPEQEQKFVARYKKFLGVQYVCIFIENTFGKH